MTTTINGLHSCKPGNEPQVGQVKTFLIINNPAREGKKSWTKIKAAPEDMGGTPFRILSAEPTGFTDQHGNISFNIEIEPAVGAFQQAKATMEGPPIVIGTPVRSFDSGLDSRQRAIIRQHSQSMALEVLKLKVTLNELTVEDLTPSKLKQLADYFDNDAIGAATQ